jgi:sulfonate transport system permease protein
MTTALLSVGRTIWRSLLSWTVPLALIALWQILAQTGVLSSRILPAPTAVLLAALRLLHNGQLQTAIAVSTRRALLGFFIGGGIGLVFGLLNGIVPLANRLLDSTLQMVRNVPPLSLIPMVILWFGIDEEAKIVLGAFGVFFPIYLNTYHGVRSVDSGLREMGATFGLSKWGLFWHVILPGALPSILVGIRFGLGLMWVILIVSETISANSGIGYLTMDAREFMQTDEIVLGILIYALLGKLADLAAKLLERSLLPWQTVRP